MPKIKNIDLRPLDKIWFVGTFTGACRLGKGFIMSAIYAIVMLGQLFTRGKTSEGARKEVIQGLKDMRRGLAALTPILGTYLVNKLEKHEENVKKKVRSAQRMQNGRPMSQLIC